MLTFGRVIHNKFYCKEVIFAALQILTKGDVITGI